MIKDRLLGIALDLEKEADLYELAKAEGGLPPGSLGKVWFNEAKREVEQFVEQWGTHLKGEKSESVILDVDFEGLRLKAELGPFVEGRQILYRCVDKVKAKDRLRFWVRHLFASAFIERGGVETRHYSMEKKFLSLNPIDGESARQQIRGIIEIYRKGISQPLPFFPEASFAFISERLKPTPEKRGEEPLSQQTKAIGKAKGKWYPSDYNKNPESILAANQLCFREEPFELIDFAGLAEKIYGPFLKASGSGEGNEV